MAEVKKAPTYRPWLSNFIWSMYGLALLWLSWRFLYLNGYTDQFLVAMVVCGLFTVWHWKSFMVRSRGQRVEARALKALGKIVGAQLQKSVPLPGRGDIDGVLTFIDQKFNIEIKSIQDASKVTSKHAAQAMAASIYLKSTPVIWLPEAKVVQVKVKDGVTIYGCNAKDLVKYLKR